MASKARKKPVTPEVLGRKFAALLERDLTEEERRLVLALNLARGDCSCATHDFLDANETMLEAAKAVGAGTDPGSDAHANLWDDAWQMAKNEGFWWKLPETTAKSYEVKVEVRNQMGEWIPNGLRFATVADADEYRRGIFRDWTAVQRARIFESMDPVTEKSKGAV